MTDKTRALIVEQEGRLHLDEDQIDIYDYATAHIDDWQPATELPSFETVSTVYLDIETYSNNRMVLGAFRRALEYGVLHPKNDAPCGRFLIDHMTDMVEESSHIAARLESGSTAESEDEYIIASICDFIDEHLEEYAALDFDIDPRGALQSDRSVIVLIGLMNEAGKPYIIDAHNLGERAAISELFRILDKKKPTFLGHFNGFGFDLPFIVGRCSALRMKHPFWIPPYLTTHRTAQMFNKPTEYQAYWLNHGDTAIVDLFHQSLAWDFVNRKLTRYTLKEVCLQLKLRDERRLELSYAEMKACVETGDLTRLKEYLVYDLEDSKLIGDFLLPDIYYQKQILPHWGYQKISTGGMGTKWNDLLMTEYGKLDTNFTAPIPDEPKKFTGGLVGGSAGLYRNVSKIDVASLYPSIMLLYQVCSCKDTAKLLLRVLKYMRTDRLRLKAIAGKNKGTKIGKDADQRQGSKKVFINSGYGVLGVPTKEFNDYKAAAMVTGYGRAILKKMIEACESSGCVPACFTGDTQVMTDAGGYAISDILDKPVKVLNSNGDWVPTVFKSYGVSQLMEVTMKRGNEIVKYRATPNHRWYVNMPDGSKTVYTTDKLKPATKCSGSGSKMSHIMPKHPEMDYVWDEGFLHGVVYGDGSLTRVNANSDVVMSIQLYGEKAILRDKFYASQDVTVISESTDKRHIGSIALSIKSKTNFKQLPDIASDNRYLYGFVCGLISTDGSVNTKKIGVRIFGKKETIDYVSSISNRCGLKVSNVTISSTKEQSGYSTTKGDTWYISFDTSSFNRQCLYRPSQYEKFDNIKGNYDWRVISVTKLPEVETVYCCREPITNAFVLSTGCLTGNSFDTDGLYFSTSDTTFAKNLEAYKTIQDAMPDGIFLEYEVEALIFYVPPASTTDDDGNMIGMKKNYIIITQDRKTGEIKIKANGKFRKRDKSKLETGFTPGLVRAYLDGKHVEYYHEVRKQLMLKTYPVEMLSITRKIKSTEKLLVDLGIGRHNDVVTIWKASDKKLYGKKGQELKKVEAVWVNNPVNIDWGYYISMVDDMFAEFQSAPKFG